MPLLDAHYNTFNRFGDGNFASIEHTDVTKLKAVEMEQEDLQKKLNSSSANISVDTDSY